MVRSSIKPLKSKAQVTIFVIVGIVLLLAASLVFFLVRSSNSWERSSLSQEEITLRQADFENAPPLEERVTGQPSEEPEEVFGDVEELFSDCVQTTATTLFEEATAQSGLLEPIPANHVEHDGELFIVLFDQEYPGAVTYGRDELAKRIAQQTPNQITSCLGSVLTQGKFAPYDFDILVNDIQTITGKDSFSIIQEYEIVIDGVSFAREDVTTIQAPYFVLFDQAEEIVDQVLETYWVPNPQFNLQLCLQLKEQHGFAPRYPLDFLQELPDEVVGIELQQEYFIISLEEKEQIFSFAILPLLVDPIC